jgi:hypothetical protein
MLAVIAFAADQIADTADAGRPDAAPATASATVTARAESVSASARPAPPPSPATPSPAAPAATLTSVSVTPVSAIPFGPGGTSDGDNPQDAALALPGNGAKSWHTDWYSSPTFGNLKPGTGLLLDLGRTVTLTGAAFRLGAAPGASLQLRAGITTDDLATVAADTGAGGLVRLRLSAPVHARYLLIWFTRLPSNGNGSYEAYVSQVTATATR